MLDGHCAFDIVEPVRSGNGNQVGKRDLAYTISTGLHWRCTFLLISPHRLLGRLVVSP